MRYEDFLELVRTRRSIRRYSEEPVQRETILKIIEAARWAVSGSNSQPWEWVVVQDREKLDKIAEIIGEYYAEVKRRIPGYPVHMVSYFRRVPALIVVCADNRVRVAWPPSRADALLDFSFGAAIQVILLAAASLGLGSAWVSGVADEKTQAALKSLLTIPGNISVVSCVPIGKVEHPPGSRYRRPLEDMVHWEEFESSKLRGDEEMTQQALHKLMSRP